MRSLPVLAALLALPLSGCLQGDTGGTATFTPTCPNWTEAQHPLVILSENRLYQAQGDPTQRTTSETIPIGGGKGPVQPPADENGKRADRYVLRAPGVPGQPIVVDNGVLTFRAYRNDTNQTLAITDYDHPDQSRMEWTFPSGYRGGANLQVGLGPATQDPQPGVIRLDSTFKADAGHVIGHKSDTHPEEVGASFSLAPYVQYRAVGCVAKA
ncbi:MAG: hypothetical protein QOI63_1172 [Thermoplasmata archaeon]|nr:hypothetical protein [Thermoplasmata archaeon]